ncbi:MAG: hypothetical protein ACT4PT_10780 [Methanobacteriota archaeon]
MTLNVAKVQQVQLEFLFGSDSTRAFVTSAEKADLKRRFRLTFWKKEEDAPLPSWKQLEDGSIAFCPGSGYAGTGSLWTRPVELKNVPNLESAIFRILERRTLNGHFGPERLIAHVRSEPVIGETGTDLATFAVPLHETDDPSEEAWHGHEVELSRWLREHIGHERYVTFELSVGTETPSLVTGGCAIRFKDVSLSFVGHA